MEANGNYNNTATTANLAGIDEINNSMPELKPGMPDQMRDENENCNHIEKTKLRNLLTMGQTTLQIWTEAIKYDDLITDFVEDLISVIQYNRDINWLQYGIERLTKLFGPNQRFTIKFKCEGILSFSLGREMSLPFIKLVREIISYFEIVKTRLHTNEAFDYELLRKVAGCMDRKEFNQEALRMYQILFQFSKNWSTIEDEKEIIQCLVQQEKFDEIDEFLKEYRRLHFKNWEDEFVEMRLNLGDFMLNIHKKMTHSALSFYEDVYYRFKDKLYDSDYFLVLRSLKGMTSALLHLLPDREEDALIFAEKVHEIARWHDDNWSIVPLRTLYDVAINLKELGYVEISLEYLNYCQEQTTPGVVRFERQGRTELLSDSKRVIEEISKGI